jgi:3'(2'), 5'-bisphosphate nucleotidase
MVLAEYLPPVKDIAVEAGEAILNIYHSGQFEAYSKSDQTPVTSADLAANDILISRLQALTPDIPVLSEEQADVAFEERRNWDSYWLLDPLDGTGEFIKRSGDFAVVIALVQFGEPVLGVIYAPVDKICYFAARGAGAFRQDSSGMRGITVHHVDNQEAMWPLRVAVSLRQQRQLIRERLDPQQSLEYIPKGSSSLKSCMVAEGVADCYVRIGPTGEWDTGAAQCIVEEAGGLISDLNLQPLSYNERESLENPNFIVIGDNSLPWRALLIEPLVSD